MPAKRFLPRVGEKWTRVRNIGAAGEYVAHIRLVEGKRIEYRTDSKKLPGTRMLDLANFLANFAPPGCTEPLMPEPEPRALNPDKPTTIHILRPSKRVMAGAGR